MQALAADLTGRHRVAVRVIAADLSTPDGVEQVDREVQKLGIEIDVLVNNAGFGSQGRFAQMDASTQVRMIAVNIVALTRLTRLFLPAMLQRQRGRILNVASMAAFQPGPYMAVYYATKAFVLSLSEALDDEVRSTPITVTALCPGATHTAFDARADMAGAALFQGRVMDAGTVAAAGYRGMMRGARVVIPGWRNQLRAIGARLAPRRFVLRVARNLNRVKRAPKNPV